MAPRAVRSLLAAVRRTIERRRLLRPATPVLVAVSSGPDSTALAHALAIIAAEPSRRAAEPEPPRLVGLAHLHHGLRGADADGDADACAGLARALGVPLHTERLADGALREAPGGSLQAAARRARYRFLESAARDAGASAVAVAHTATDQAETVLFRILRGAGLAGLGGMPARRRVQPGSPIRLVRPLIDVPRDHVSAFLDALDAETREDSSNRDLRYARARVRHELLPMLRRSFNPQVEQALLRLSRSARRTRRLLDADADRLLGGSDQALGASLRAGVSSQLPVGPLRRARPAVRDAALARLLAAVCPDRVSATAVEDLEELVMPLLGPRRHGPAVSLPGGAVARRQRDCLIFDPPDATAPETDA